MRTFNLICFFLCFGRLAANAQQYNKLLGDSNKWNQTLSLSLPWQPLTVGNYLYHIGHDTDVNDKTYKKVYINEGKVITYIREDTLKKRIFCLDKNDFNAGEFILYDFSLKVGDSVEGIIWNTYQPEPINYYTDIFVVSSIKKIKGLKDSLNLLEGYRPYDNSGGDNRFMWLEGVGSPAGFLLNSLTLDNSMYRLSLACMFKNNVLVYKYDSTMKLATGVQAAFFNSTIAQHGCDYTTRVTAISTPPSFGIDKQWSIYPNPATQFVYIDGIGEAENLDIYDAQGKLICQKVGRLGQTETINIEQWPAGIYFLKVATNGKCYKLVKPY